MLGVGVCDFGLRFGWFSGLVCEGLGFKLSGWFVLVVAFARLKFRCGFAGCGDSSFGLGVYYFRGFFL